jgi:hypothetical protein
MYFKTGNTYPSWARYIMRSNKVLRNAIYVGTDVIVFLTGIYLLSIPSLLSYHNFWAKIFNFNGEVTLQYFENKWPLQRVAIGDLL